VPAAPVATCVTMAVPATSAGDRPVSANSPIVTRTPPGPTAVIPMPAISPHSASAASVASLSSGGMDGASSRMDAAAGRPAPPRGRVSGVAAARPALSVARAAER
jgi:hypothetical protein